MIDEGNSFRAAVVLGVESAKDPTVTELTTRQFPEDYVSEEYLNRDN